MIIFTLNILLAEFGAADISGAGAALGAVTQLGPLTTVLVIAGAGATAICADLGARTIREEIDAMEVLGIDPIHRLVVPRVVAATIVAALLNGAVITIGLVGGFVFKCLHPTRLGRRLRGHAHLGHRSTRGDHLGGQVGDVRPDRWPSRLLPRADHERRPQGSWNRRQRNPGAVRDRAVRDQCGVDHDRRAVRDGTLAWWSLQRHQRQPYCGPATHAQPPALTATAAARPEDLSGQGLSRDSPGSASCRSAGHCVAIAGRRCAWSPRSGWAPARWPSSAARSRSSVL
ncbi:hypothetical protein MRGA423_03670 [Mycobacterium tuberculosis RGTB423]|nr:hypothetical protein MRGA423_03670 [Mycobacterium tuberculosis RGTB423]